MEGEIYEKNRKEKKGEIRKTERKVKEIKQTIQKLKYRENKKKDRNE
jgi:hypothetical protein